MILGNNAKKAAETRPSSAANIKHNIRKDFNDNRDTWASVI